MEFKHQSVLLQEAMRGLNIIPNGIYVDCTLGRSGHSLEILKHLATGKLYCFEQDEEAIVASQQVLQQSNYDNYEIIKNNFVNLAADLQLRQIKTVNGILYDLGVSSPQLDDDKRGFSYRYDSVLDMRMNQQQILTAKTVINTYSIAALAKVFQEYGEEPFAKVIAKNIGIARAEQPIATTFELVTIIKKSLPQKVLKKAKHPAKRIFQALRIEVNQELAVLQTSLEQATKMLAVKGRLVVISFHSLEDRIVKKYFQTLTQDPNYEINQQLPTVSHFESNYRIITKKAIVPALDEQTLNPRSTSAKLRILERVK
ncbi:16S rRNA (cytosine(1402)-N(4))-methyltransferase RsmH [Spiroplasma poulsonii]|uniref:Ribosomal RNA small subunit methyltransferase H n=1 Tax=Spiroplasma poulsonii TaxID=2138 RepID=A0A3S0UBM6_9MOLU|nr:16S rRNA (cytosine(1402)-N(4))-methyltransferase RsmH [Spiroplasma poulsonii]MBW3058437.1 16S rRNA (cytosine(1402)-N(4))-methyltransferase [Spiroplasma poulsonii]RUP77464.1 16S rRNA (cytosine(1402)-N(4))-methyltransferase RsmH [Spiroplasma poulsonii]